MLKQWQTNPATAISGCSTTLHKLQDVRACDSFPRHLSDIGPTSYASNSEALMATTRASTPLLIIFLDLTRFAAQSLRVDDAELAETVDVYYQHVARAIHASGGTTVKFIGDATLAVFPEHAVDSAIRMLLELKSSVDRLMTDKGWECRLLAKVHFGDVIAGQFGPDGSERFDVIGRAVNTTATLQSSGIALSVEAFRKLSSELRKEFKKHTPPITYIRHEDPRPFKGT
jgi:adenylate cyclase